jgi:uncharacterized RDD family membrane protein YckC
VELDDRITISTPEGVELELQLAGLASRFIAAMADGIIQLVLLVVLVLVTGVTGGGHALDIVLFVIGVFLIWVVYPIAFEVLARGRTPGKRLTHLRVVRERGNAVDLPASAIRNVIRLLEGPVTLYIPMVISIVATLVVREEPRPRSEPATHVSVHAPNMIESWQDWDVTAVTDADIATVRRFLGRRETSTARRGRSWGSA